VLVAGLALSGPARAAPPASGEQPAATRFERIIDGSIIGVMSQLDASVLVINRGTNHDAALGDQVRLDSGPTCALSELYATSYGDLTVVYFTPSSARHAAWTGLSWIVFDAP